MTALAKPRKHLGDRERAKNVARRAVERIYPRHAWPPDLLAAHERGIVAEVYAEIGRLRRAIVKQRRRDAG